MTAAEFARLARLLPGRAGAAREAAFLVLVSGATIRQAARHYGITAGAVSRIVARLRQLQTIGCPTCGRHLQETST